ncbi:hypothetical protein AVEN_223520-1 [Araneus ventricosus]|uniref:Uncharacterized protein n=1 Tax=Araneus ventricosus TaxID=182803 RepID=A0A4Y2M3W8_ARAVE|nr:hypothetical protein AVEN_223520-1 [Araneus ventricosus]
MQTRPHYEHLIQGSHPRRYFPSSAMGPSTSQDTTILPPKRADNRLIYMTASLLRIRGSSLGRGDLVVWSRLGAGRFQVRNLISLKIRLVWSPLHVNSYVVAKRLLVGVGRMFGEWVPAQVSSSSSDRGSKLRCPSQNSPSVA